ncbi:MAG: single-stranded DNA-binding protein [Protaetiibacter sp.]
MTDTMTVAGLVATEPKHTITNEGLEILSFRLASTHRRFDRASAAWVDGETNWFTITAFRQLAGNAAVSIEKGHRVLATGRLRVREWRDGEKLGRDVEIIADALGPDLTWGRAQYTRAARQQPADPGRAAEPLAAPSIEAGLEATSGGTGFPVEAQAEALAVPF